MRWVFVPYDQLTDEFGPLSETPADELGIVLVESPAKGKRRPYHKQKLALVLANLRHFAEEQRERGVTVRHVVSEGSYADALAPIADEVGGLQVMEPAERELRVDLEPLVQEGLLEVLPHAGWLTSRETFRRSQKNRPPPWRMDAFYREVRRQTGILMEDGSPVGGKYSHDADNRQPWRGEPAAPPLPTFPVTSIKREVASLIEERFADHPGRLDLDALPATRDDAELLWTWAKQHALPLFGPYEDAMSRTERTLFHTRLSALLNLGRLHAHRLLEEVLELDLPLSSQEGFVRQIIGWREFIHHVHRETDGFRELPDPEVHVEPSPGDGGYARWAGREWESTASGSTATTRGDGGAAPRFLGGDTPLPRAFWGTPSGLECLDNVVASVWDEGYGHHITRLMVLGNLATLLDVNPREVTDWFWCAYTDAFDWVVEPNVLGMGTFAVGEVLSTKPYVCGSSYIDKMSDYCGACRFHPKKDCPVTPLYWAFLARHEEKLADNPRMKLILASLRKRTAEKKAADRETFENVRDRLLAGETLA